MNSKKTLLFLVLVFLGYSSSFGQIRSEFPEKPVPQEIQNFKLLPVDFSTLSYLKTNLSREPGVAGWDTKKSRLSEDIVQGLLDCWAIGEIRIGTKYGFFEDPILAKTAAYTGIFYLGYPLVIERESGSFSGTLLGDHAFHWEITNSHIQVGEVKQSILSFSKGRYAVLVYAHSKGQSLDNNFLEQIAKKLERKIDVAMSSALLSSQIPALVTKEGLLRSLLVKLDHFYQNYRQGDYKVALNNITSFINELDAQRGKHVSEAAYQALKAYTDTIVQSLNSLM